jgi:drug/metabolite transporter (DMT)-like permease
MTARAPALVWLAVGLGMVAFGASSILVRFADSAPGLALAAWRTAFSVLLVAPAALTSARHEWRTLSGRDWALLLAAGVLLALHFTTWILSLYYTSVASAAALVTTSPLFIAALGAVFLGERPGRRTVVATVAAVAGAALIGWGDAQDAAFPRAGFGNALALAAAVLVSVYLLIGRVVRQRVSFFAYMVPLYAVVAAVTVGWAVGAGTPLAQPGKIVGLCLLMALGPGLLGHGSVNLALRYLPAALLGLLSLAEPVLATTFAFVLFGERPSVMTLAGIVVVLAAIGVVIASERRAARGRVEEPE